MPGILMRDGKVLFDVRTGKILYGEPGDACCCFPYSPGGCIDCDDTSDLIRSFESEWSGTSGGLVVSPPGWQGGSAYVVDATGIYLTASSFFDRFSGGDVSRRVKWNLPVIRKKTLRYTSKMRAVSGGTNGAWHGSTVFFPNAGSLLSRYLLHRSRGDGDIGYSTSGMVADVSCPSEIEVEWSNEITSLIGTVALIRTVLRIDGSIVVDTNESILCVGALACSDFLTVGLSQLYPGVFPQYDPNWGVDSYVFNISVTDTHWL
jgi:hypothetical protein